MSSREEVEKKIIELIGNACEQEWEHGLSCPMTGDTRLKEDLQLDSVLLIILQVNIEDCFHIRFRPLEDDYASIFQTVGALGDYIMSRLEKKAGWYGKEFG